MKSLLLIACALTLLGCTSSRGVVPEGVLLASILVVEDAHSGPSKGRTGVVFLVRELPTNAVGPVLEGYEYRDGKVVDAFGGGSDSRGVIEAIKRSNLEPFDFQQEVTSATARLRKEAEGRDEQLILGGSRDGALWEIVVLTEKGRLSIRERNPGGSIDAYAPYSEHLARLKLVMDQLALYYGRVKIGI